MLDINVDPAIVGEVAKVLIQTAFGLLRVNGKSEAEIEALYLSEKQRFIANDPAKLPDV